MRMEGCGSTSSLFIYIFIVNFFAFWVWWKDFCQLKIKHEMKRKLAQFSPFYAMLLLPLILIFLDYAKGQILSL